MLLALLSRSLPTGKMIATTFEDCLFVTAQRSLSGFLVYPTGEWTGGSRLVKLRRNVFNEDVICLPRKLFSVTVKSEITHHRKRKYARGVRKNSIHDA